MDDGTSFVQGESWFKELDLLKICNNVLCEVINGVKV